MDWSLIDINVPRHSTAQQVILTWTIYKIASITDYALLLLELKYAGSTIWQQMFQITTR